MNLYPYSICYVYINWHSSILSYHINIYSTWQSGLPTRCRCTSTAKRRKMMCMGIGSKAFLAPMSHLFRCLWACECKPNPKQNYLVINIWVYTASRLVIQILLYHVLLRVLMGFTIVMNLNQAKFNMHEHGTSRRKTSNQLECLLESGFIMFHHLDVFHTTSRFSPVSASFWGDQPVVTTDAKPDFPPPVGVGFHHGHGRLEPRRPGADSAMNFFLQCFDGVRYSKCPTVPSTI